MIIKTKTGLAIAALAVAGVLAGCTIPPPQDTTELRRIEQELKEAYGDKYTAEYGHTDLARAETFLAAARKALTQPDTAAEVTHDLTLAEGYITLAQIHGRQERAKTETVALKAQQSQIMIAARDRDAERARNASGLRPLDRRHARDLQQFPTPMPRTPEQTAQAMREQLRDYDLRFGEYGASLVLQDVMFETGSAALRSGSSARLAPLMTYLRANPATLVRVEGHTDSVGSTAQNDDLSVERANAVARALTQDGTLTNQVQAYGFGQTQPVATNTTPAGREQNRRVEIILVQ
ncbi:OmpA family protein [Pararhodospirillum photometricum]|uniref:Outer membrane protein OmpA n=1 Tax=Pararhodospirillum photometricum DSM 122 TaxID=1150469 RepID=H6SPU8_PARPM|nr:OmpA family protein [Pararhodospirillum photometricum]CCG07218.1 Outer membrane protein OmpA [Pararhodospirillum photometricum DSM 122]